jgi:uncharacterized protein (UPF0548 family)
LEVRILTASRARTTEPSCAEYATREINATREEVDRGGYAHDVYRVSLSGPFARAIESLLSYQIFAPQRMFACVCTPDRRVAFGATIVQRIILGPAAIESAVRVIEFEKSADRAYFAYATLKGHAERGLASFAVQSTAGVVTFEAQAWSKPGTWLTKLGRPISRVVQRALTREAVESFSNRVAHGAG